MSMARPEFDAPDEQQASHRLLWAPWRIAYVGGERREPGCVFCNRLTANDDVDSLMLWRAEDAFVILNLFPYNTGHLMIVPNEHVATPESLSKGGSRAMADLLPLALRALRRALSCEGFNVGMNLGDVAGAGIAAHLHQHVVPRWLGDTNFMPVVGATKVMPELLPTIYAKLRTELALEIDATRSVSVVVLSPDRTRVLTVESADAHSLPTISRDPDKPAWLAARNMIEDMGIRATLAGWAGTVKADALQSLAIAFEATSMPTTQQAGAAWQPVQALTPPKLDAQQAEFVANALARTAE